MNPLNERLQAVRWEEDKLYLLDQRVLPHTYTHISLETASQVAIAIKDMVVRGAPAIGITAAYGVVLAAREAYQKSPEQWQTIISADMQTLAQARPTAVNLVWALERMQKCFSHISGNPESELLSEAKAIHQEDIDANYTMGNFGSSLLPKNCRILTHCNAGALATGGYGTALGVVRSGFSDNKITQVYADETRPWLQGTRLTAWELLEDHIPVTLVTESAAATLMKEKMVDWVIVGSDRIAANGDVANKIGTYHLAVLARYHGVKVMVAAPLSTVDFSIATGSEIKVEEREAHEILTSNGQRIAPLDAQAWNPVFDVTPAELVDAIVTEKGIIEQPTTEKLQQWR